MKNIYNVTNSDIDSDYNNNVDIKFSVHDEFLEYTLGTLKLRTITIIKCIYINWAIQWLNSACYGVREWISHI